MLLDVISSFMAILIVIASLSPSLAIAGANGGGGGDIVKSTPQDVVDSVRSAYSSELFYVFTELRHEVHEIQDPVLNTVFSKMFGIQITVGKPLQELPSDYPAPAYRVNSTSKGPIFDQIDKVRGQVVNGTMVDEKYFLSSQPCPADDGVGHAASVNSFSLDSSICYSNPILSQIPKSGLMEEILAISTHELTHQFGFGEMEARRVYSFFTGVGRKFLQERPMKTPNGELGLLNFDLGEAELALNAIHTGLVANFSSKNIVQVGQTCRWIGNVEAKAEALVDKYVALTHDPNSANSWELLKQAITIRNSILKLSDTCDLGLLEHRSQAIQTLQEVKMEIQIFQDRLNSSL